jgi:hypothetical protein
MSTTKMIKPPPPLPPRSANGERSETVNAPPFNFEPPPREERLGEIVPLVTVVPVAGPPVIFLVVPWVLFALMLTGPFLLLVTFVLAGVILVALTAAVLGPPYLLVRHLRKHLTRRHERYAPAHEPHGLQPIGVSVTTRRSGAQPLGGSAAEPSAAGHLHGRTQTHLTPEGI